MKLPIYQTNGGFPYLSSAQVDKQSVMVSSPRVEGTSCKLWTEFANASFGRIDLPPEMQDSGPFSS